MHIAPANTFRTVMESCKAHCKLGLTATLVREDDKIEDLSYLIGPKLHEANWSDLAERGYLATVRCCEVLCLMSHKSMKELLEREHLPQSWRFGGQKLLSIMNPNKFRAAEFLVNKHSADKVLLFSDDIDALEVYCDKLHVPKLFGKTPDEEREALLGCFRGDEVYVFRNYVRKKRTERRMGKNEWADVYNGVDTSDPYNEQLKNEFLALSASKKKQYEFNALGLSSVGDVAIDL